MGADFSGYATKAGVRCSDGRTITPEAFVHMNGKTVPLVWQHGHDSPDNVLGHAVLEARPDGVYAHGYFNDTPRGQVAKAIVQHGDVTALSIFANNLVQKAKNVVHGVIREVSLAIAGANEGALIENVQIEHMDGSVDTAADEALISAGEPLEHVDGSSSSEESDLTVQEIYDEMTEEQQNVVHFMVGEALKEGSEVEHADGETNKTFKAVYDGLDEDQKNVVHIMIGESIKAAAKHSDKEGTGTMTHNIFEDGGAKKDEKKTLTHDQLKTIVADAKNFGGSLKDSFLAHAVEYGIENIDLLFPDFKALTESPDFIARRMEWVTKVLDGVKKSPFSRIKTMTADITHDEARARGYVKGNLKREEWFALSKRETTPTTIYKKQKLDRDDIIDITDLDVVAWLKAEMRIMLDEELARAILIGDGRPVEDPDNEGEPNPDKIDETKIRPIAYDDEFYTHRIIVPANVSGDAMVETVLRARPTYRGSGNPTLFCSLPFFTDMLLAKDKLSRRLYATKADLEAALQVKEIVTVEVMENQNVDNAEVLAILVNLNDYTVGATRGGQVSMFDDFDIDYNQHKYLIETRCCGTLTKFKSAQVFVRGVGALVVPVVPAFNPATGVVTIPTVVGVTYVNRDTEAELEAGAQDALDPGDSLDVVATLDDGYYVAHNTDTDWQFTRPVA